MRNWLLASPESPWASAALSSMPAPTPASVWLPASTVATRSGSGRSKFSSTSSGSSTRSGSVTCSGTKESGIADPRVQHAVEDVGGEVEEDDEGGRDQQVGQHYVRV